jgi:GT2 family glycosyltransferase
VTISVIIATYGDQHWEDLARSRAMPSVGDTRIFKDILCWHEPDGTRATSLNNGAYYSLGDWLCFLDADDELAPGYLGAMRRALEQQTDGTSVLLTPAVQQIRNGGKPSAPFFRKDLDLRTDNWLVIGTLISRELFNQIGGFHEHPHGLEDWNLWARAVRAGGKIVKVPDAVYVHHVNPQSKHRQLFRNRKAFWAAYEEARVDAWG